MSVHRLGFTELSGSQGTRDGPYRVNIIFVHGLGGHPQHTWEDSRSKNRDSVNGGSHSEPTRKRKLFKRLFKSKALPSAPSLTTVSSSISVSSSAKDSSSIKVSGLTSKSSSITACSSTTTPTSVTASVANNETDKGYSKKLFWPREYLTEDIPEARIWTYGYNADAVGGVFQSNNKNSVSQHARDFAVRVERDIRNGDPILFVAHSLGGIIVKDAVRRSDVCRARTKLIVFLGTPHRGSGLAGWGKIAWNLASITLQDSNTRIIKTLDVNSEVLENIHEDFKTIVSQSHIWIHSFQEGRGISGIKGLHNKVVDDFSSKLDLPRPLETVETIDADHRQMARCGDRSDAQYRAIFGVLEHFIRTKLEEAVPMTSVAVVSTAETEDATGGTTTDRAALPCYYIPLPENRRFVGREKALDALKAMLFVEKQCQKASIVGLGGVGKTQVALRLAYWTKKHQPEFSIFWVPALSMASFEQAMTAIAKKLPTQETGEDEDPKESVQRFLSSEAAGPWLLVVDNADEEEILFGSADRPGGISDYLPESDTGLTLFTTRFQEVAVSATGSDVVELNEMDHAEAVDFLEKSLIHKSLLRDETATTELLKELTYLPLAITQAAAYINKKKVPLTEYVELLHGTQKDVIGLMSKEFRDSTRYPGSQNAVATTWLVSFDQIRKSDTAAADLLSFISRIEPKGIPQSLLPDLDSAEQFVDAIGTLCAYAFLTRRGESKVFDMHSLVHLATQIWVQREGLAATADEDATWHLATIFPTADYDNRNKWREYLPHALKLLQNNGGLDTEERSDLLLAVGRCLEVDGRTEQAIEILEEACEWPNRTLAEDHPSRLTAQRALGEAYHAHCRFKDAIDVLEEVVDIESRALANNHHARLASQHALAGAYQADGQTEKAIILLEHIVAIEAGMLAEDDNDRLRSQHTLAMAYHANGQLKEAIALFERLVAIKARVLPSDHFNQLSSQHALAMAYQANGQVTESIALLERVVAVETQTFPEDHYLLLTSQHGLARAYQTNGQTEKAMALLEHVVAVRAQGLPDDHLSRLASEYSLAINFHANGEVKRAITILEQILRTQTREFCDDNPLRLKSELALAKAYQANGQVKAAIGLLEHVVTHYTKVLPGDHPTRLETEELLAYSYTSENDGRVNKAVALLEQIVAIKARVLAEDHPSRLSSQQALAITYGANGQIKEAVALLEHVAAMKARILPSDHPSLLASEDWLASMMEEGNRDDSK